MSSLPENYHEVLYWKLSHHTKLLIILNVVGLLLLALSAALFFAWAGLWHPASFSVNMTVGAIVGTLVGVFLTIVLHELTHGLALQAYGAHPKYGIMWKEMMFYATAPGHAFRRNAYLVIALAPLVGLSALAALLLMLPLPGWAIVIIGFCAAMNVGSAIGDMWLVRVALAYPARAYIVDEQDGLRVFMPLAEV
ncbi:MAG TPA: DUF3267 domain-containing protein [Anaerolineae bacterium]|nr:DUF3267 domain-containing protein [Anaerolineae bacterium]HQI87151.1 DUF3267 domain-containing protein [Anaerolineae bacterium]